MAEEASLAKDGHHLRRSDRHNSLTAAANAALMTEVNVSQPPLGDPGDFELHILDSLCRLLNVSLQLYLEGRQLPR